jgi:hypothetical protein
MSGPVSETLVLATGKAGAVLAALGIAPPRRGHMRCPLGRHADRTPSWRWDDRRECWFCTCGSGDLLDLVQAMGVAHDHISAAGFVRDVLGEEPLGKRRQETAAQRAKRERRQAEALAKAEAMRQQREQEAAAHAKEQRRKALRMWLRAGGATGTIAARYLEGRGITCQLPGTLRFLPPVSAGRHPAMLAAFGMPDEHEPGLIRIPPMRLVGIHYTLLKPDGSGKATNADGISKLTIGVGHNLPIVLAPPNDGMAICVAEGIEDALSYHQSTGIGAWAAGTAGRLPGIARHIPSYIECVTVIEDPDPAGRRYAEQLRELLNARRIEIFTARAENGH